MIAKISKVFTAFLVLTLLLSATAYAASDPLSQRIEVTNSNIEQQIDIAIAQADRALATCMTRIDAELIKLDNGSQTFEEAQDNISVIKAAYETNLDNIACRLISTTDQMAFILMKQAGKYDVEIINEYVELQLGDHIYLVDPLRIVGN